MTDDNDRMSRDEAIEYLNDQTGQTYATSQHAFRVLAAFADEVAVEYIRERWPFEHTEVSEDADEDAALTVLASHLRDTQTLAGEARGITSAWAFQPIVCVAEVSGILVEALGGEADDREMGGGGFTMDARHKENLKTLDELLDGADAAAEA